jgi:DNA-binding transcriptional ArsR family regulator
VVPKHATSSTAITRTGSEIRSPAARELHAAAQFLKALSHPLRLALVCGLLKSSSTQTAISRQLRVPQSTIAQHLRVLRNAGVIRGTREGAVVRFVVCDPRAQHILETICKALRPGKDSWEEMITRCKPDDLHTPR